MTKQNNENQFLMEIETSKDAFDDSETTTTTSTNLIYQAVRFSSNEQRELSVSLGQTKLHVESTSDLSISDDDNDDNSDVGENSRYIPHATYSRCSTNQRFPTFRLEFDEDRWQPIRILFKTEKFFVRKQSRKDPQRRDVCENDIVLRDLESEFDDSGPEASVWYHATGWESAIKKVEDGPQISEGPLDLAYHGAFYLNSNYRDCHDWFYTRDSKFQGKHAMLFYKFHPELLSKKGKRVFDIKKWKNLAGERSQSSGKFDDDWTYTYQNSDPSHVHKSGDNAKVRKTSDGQHAMQLVIYTEKMCAKIHRHLIGCVYYEYCDA